MRRAWACLFLLPSLVSADEVVLRGGGRISGMVVEERVDAVVIDIGPGRVILPAARVERVVRGNSALAEFRTRASQVGAGDAAGWLALANWARDRALDTQAREAYERVLALEPQNAAANQALGRVQLGTRWVTPEDSYRAQGLVPFEGRWVTPAEAEFALRERALRREDDLRAREAADRARSAEVRAAQTERREEPTPEGIPWIYTAGGTRPPHRHREADPPPRADRPPRQEPPTRQPEARPSPRPRTPPPALPAQPSSRGREPERRER